MKKIKDKNNKNKNIEIHTKIKVDEEEIILYKVVDEVSTEKEKDTKSSGSTATSLFGGE